MIRKGKSENRRFFSGVKGQSPFLFCPCSQAFFFRPLFSSAKKKQEAKHSAFCLGFAQTFKKCKQRKATKELFGSLPQRKSLIEERGRGKSHTSRALPAAAQAKTRRATETKKSEPLAKLFLFPSAGFWCRRWRLACLFFCPLFSSTKKKEQARANVGFAPFKEKPKTKSEKRRKQRGRRAHLNAVFVPFFALCRLLL